MAALSSYIYIPRSHPCVLWSKKVIAFLGRRRDKRASSRTAGQTDKDRRTDRKNGWESSRLQCRSAINVVGR